MESQNSFRLITKLTDKDLIEGINLYGIKFCAYLIQYLNIDFLEIDIEIEPYKKVNNENYYRLNHRYLDILTNVSNYQDVYIDDELKNIDLNNTYIYLFLIPFNNFTVTSENPSLRVRGLYLHQRIRNIYYEKIKNRFTHLTTNIEYREGRMNIN